ncbi:UNVERIFIED_CONTAM: hypothetical protein K2H54_020771 [Gekko kuhli]
MTAGPTPPTPSLLRKSHQPRPTRPQAGTCSGEVNRAGVEKLPHRARKERPRPPDYRTIIQICSLPPTLNQKKKSGQGNRRNSDCFLDQPCPLGIDTPASKAETRPIPDTQVRTPHLTSTVSRP